MSREEFLAQYGDFKVKFSSYYKYVFYYNATLEDGSRICCQVGGNSDAIYKHSVSADNEELVSDLDAFAGSVEKDGAIIAAFYDY